MHYEAFKAAFLVALRASELPTIGTRLSQEALDLHSTDRTVTVYAGVVSCGARVR
jgi:hypothetical protein